MTVIPAAVICYLPMKNQLKHGMRQLVLNSVLLFAITLPTAALISCLFGLIADAFLIILLPIYFFVYHNNLKTHISKSLAVSRLYAL